jgi:nucleoside-diphosphate-sugar epimerase
LPPPRLLITGASGFVGRRLVAELQERYQVIGLARRSRTVAGVPEHPNLSWIQCDIGDGRAVERAFSRIREDGDPRVVFHLAAHYDFTGVESVDYWRTNVDGLRHVLEQCRPISLERFVFASSVAACRFPPPGRALDEDSPSLGDHIYAVTKHLGEEMLAEYSGSVPSVIVRFAALFSDWCEYPPLFAFLRTWTSNAWNRDLLAGKGRSAIPYLHVRDAVAFLLRLLERREALADGEVLIASTDGAVSHAELFDVVTAVAADGRRRPRFVPRPLCRIGLHAMDRVGQLLGQRPFERPWMGRYIDLALTVDGGRTRRKLGWAPRARLEILRRMPFLLENLGTHPTEWYRRNEAKLKPPRLTTALVIHGILEQSESRIVDEMVALLRSPGSERFRRYRDRPPGDLEWDVRVAVRHLLNAIRTQDRAVLGAYCRDLAGRRFREGFSGEEVREAVWLLAGICEGILRQEDGDLSAREALSHVTTTLRFACDQMEDVFEELEGPPGGWRGLGAP